MHLEGHGGTVAKLAELIDFGPGCLAERPLPRSSCHRAGASEMAGLPVSWRTKALVVGEGTLQELCLGLVLPLCRIARNPEFMHSQLKGGPLHAKMCRCAVGAGYNPIALFQSLKNLLTFLFLQNLAKSAICRFRRCGFFHRKAGL